MTHDLPALPQSDLPLLPTALLRADLRGHPPGPSPTDFALMLFGLEQSRPKLRTRECRDRMSTRPSNARFTQN